MMFFCAKVLCEKVFVQRARKSEGHQTFGRIQKDQMTTSITDSAIDKASEDTDHQMSFTIEPGFHILYIDTEGSFSITRFRPLLIHQLKEQHPNLPITQNLLAQLANRIKLQRVIDLDQHLITLNDLEYCIQEEEIKLVVYDSIAFFYRTETPSFEWQQLILEHGQKMYEICEKLKVCMMLVNQVTTKIDSKRRQAYFAPALGHTWSHLIAHRIFLYMTKDGVRKMGVWKSNFAPIQEFPYKIVANGIELLTESQ